MREEIKKLISESFNEALKSSDINEGSDGNYMIEQDLNVIENSLSSIRKHIEFDSVPDWVENSIAKLAGEMTSLRNYYESGGHKKDDNLYDDEEYDLESEEDEEELDLELGEEDEEDEEYELSSEDDEESEEEDEDLEEGIGTSHTMKRGMNAPKSRDK
jgi:hypothetical protein